MFTKNEVEKPFDPTHDYLTDLRKEEVIEEDGRRLPKLAGLQRLAHTFRGGVKSVSSCIENCPARDNPIAAVSVDYQFYDGSSFEGSADATTKAHKEPYSLHLVAVAEAKAEARALRRAFNITAVCAEEIGSVDNRPIQDVQVKGIMNIAGRKGLDVSETLELINRNDLPDLSGLKASEAKDLMKALNKYKPKKVSAK